MTERKRERELLREIEEKVRVIFRAASFGIGLECNSLLTIFSTRAAAEMKRERAEGTN